MTEASTGRMSDHDGAQPAALGDVDHPMLRGPAEASQAVARRREAEDQLAAAAAGQLGDLDEALAGGAFAPLRGWLTDAVHRHGARFPARVIVTRATGAAPGPAAQLARLEAKYGALYHL